MKSFESIKHYVSSYYGIVVDTDSCSSISNKLIDKKFWNFEILKSNSLILSSTTNDKKLNFTPIFDLYLSTKTDNSMLKDTSGLCTKYNISSLICILFTILVGSWLIHFKLLIIFSKYILRKHKV
jgi:hypothetical protein